MRKYPSQGPSNIFGAMSDFKSILAVFFLSYMLQLPSYNSKTGILSWFKLDLFNGVFLPFKLGGPET